MALYEIKSFSRRTLVVRKVFTRRSSDDGGGTIATHFLWCDEGYFEIDEEQFFHRIEYALRTSATGAVQLGCGTSRSLFRRSVWPPFEIHGHQWGETRARSENFGSATSDQDNLSLTDGRSTLSPPGNVGDGPSRPALLQTYGPAVLIGGILLGGVGSLVVCTGMMFVLTSINREPATPQRVTHKERVDNEFSASGGETTRNVEPTTLTDSSIAFTGEQFVLIPDLRYNGGSITIEATAMAKEIRNSTVVANFHQSGLGLEINDGKWAFVFHDGTGYKVARSDEPAKLKETVHLAGIFDGREVRLFINGALQETTATTDSRHKVSPFPFMIGADPHHTEQAEKFFNGVIDEVQISFMIRYHQDYQPMARLSPGGATVLYHFDEGRGQIAHDASPNGYNGKIIGNVGWIPNE